MPWARIDDGANSDPKLIALSDAAWRMWGCGMVYCANGLTDGFIPEYAIHTFGVRAKNKEAVAAELCRTLVEGKGSLWHKVEGGYQMHDYLEWNDARDQVVKERLQARDRFERFKKRHGNGNGNATDNALATRSQRSSTPTTPDGSTDPEPSGGARARDASARNGHAVAYEGPRLKIWKWQHEDIGRRLGAKADRFDLFAWYQRLEDELARTGESFADPWKWLQMRIYQDAQLPLPNLMGRPGRVPGAGVTGAVPAAKRAAYDADVIRATED